MPSLTVIIPAYNEASTIDAAIAETMAVLRSLNLDSELIIVDDGSTDTTSARVHDLSSRYPNVKLIRHETNQGKGAAIRSGAQATQSDFVAFLDADLATPPDHLSQALNALSTSDIVIGSRHHPKTVFVEKQPWLRQQAGRFFSRLVGRFFGLPYQDTQCGFKVFGPNATHPLKEMETSGWTFDVELLVRAQQEKLRVTELPIVWQHGRVSRVRWWHAFRIFSELQKLKTQLKK